MKVNEEKYPNTARFLKQHPDMTVDDAIAYFEKLEN